MRRDETFSLGHRAKPIQKTLKNTWPAFEAFEIKYPTYNLLILLFTRLLQYLETLL